MSWIIESGSYSDYRIHAVCATEADAKAICDRINPPDYEEYSYSECPDVTPESVQHRVTWYASTAYDPRTGQLVSQYAAFSPIRTDAPVTNVHSRVEVAWEPADQEHWTKLKPSIHIDFRGMTRFLAYGESENDARKRLGDLVAQWRSENEIDPQPGPSSQVID